MTLLPRSLLARTALVILVALLAMQAVTLVLFSRYFAQPRQQIAVAGFASHLKSISAALESIPPERHLEFVGRLQEREGIRIAKVRPEERDVVLAPDLPALNLVRANLKREFGDRADLYVRPQSPQVFLVRLPVGEHAYWVVFPRNRIERESGWAWAMWAMAGMLVALLGAYLLVRKVNQPLRELVRAARELGQGRAPPPVAVDGPSEVRAVAAAFNQMQLDLASQERERNTFLAGVSHDLRTPLARMRLNIEMLGSKVDEETREGMASDIGDMDGIVGQFLDFARAESSEAPIPASLTTLAREAVERMRRTLPQADDLGTVPANIRLELADLPDLPLRPVAIQRLIDNLLDNARKHGGGEIVVQATQGADAQVLTVQDRGPGIPAAEVEHLKLPFTRRDAARSGSSGAGLGLAIVDRIARQHGGSLDLLARDGGGLLARVTLPTRAPNLP